MMPQIFSLRHHPQKVLSSKALSRKRFSLHLSQNLSERLPSDNTFSNYGWEKARDFHQQIVLTFGTKISSMLRKQQKITASATKANEASCCDAITMATGAVIKHNTAIL
jgi:hypothetical protein